MTEVRTDRVPGWGVASSVAAPVLLLGGWTLAAQLQRDGFDSLVSTISALSARGADRRWVMTSALAGLGLAHVTTAAALRPAGRVGRALLGLGGLATLGVAAAPLPAADGSSGLHTAFASAAFVSLAVWPAFSLGGSGRAALFQGPVAFRRRVAWGVAAVLIAELAWFFVELRSDGDLVGLSERLAAGSQALWPLAAVLIARTPRGV